MIAKQYGGCAHHGQRIHTKTAWTTPHPLTQSEAYGELAHAVILQAADDWQKLCGQITKPTENAEIIRARVTFKELRKFFKSEWCLALCHGLDPLVILAGLEKELVKTRKLN